MDTNKTNILHKELCYKIVGCIYKARGLYGSGQKELVYQNGLAELFDLNSIPYKREVAIAIISPITEKTVGNYRLDFTIDEKVILETKAVKFTPVKMEQQLYSYLRSTHFEVGYLANFGSTELFVKRVILTNDRKHVISIR